MPPQLQEGFTHLYPMDINILGDCVEAAYREIDHPNSLLSDIIASKTKPSDFEIVKNIAKGGYGEVFLAKKDKIYAMKRVPKELVLKQPHTALFMAEKEVMTESISEWLVKAHMTIQDEDYLYYLMDFIPGGDLMGLLSKEDILDEGRVRFYAAEIVAALDSLHKLGWIHRDLKPDNVLIDKNGHIKLGDFGSCIRMKDGRARSSVTVGTPDYVSPDILSSMHEECEYGEEVDFWTLGIILYEMIYGTTPFYSETLIETYRKINNVDFIFPFELSSELTDLISNLICRSNKRLGISQIKAHPFFKDINWERIRETLPPFIPEIRDEEDTSNFVDTHFEAEKHTKSTKLSYIPFIGFTFDPDLTNFIRSLIMHEGDEGRIANFRIDSTLLHIKSEYAEYCNKLEKAKKYFTEISDRIENSTLEHQEVKAKLEESRNELKNILIELICEKEELEELRGNVEINSKQLISLNSDLEDRKFVEVELINKKCESDNQRIGHLVANFMKLFQEEYKEINQSLNEIRSIAVWLCNENKYLQSEVTSHKQRYQEILSIKTGVESENRALHDQSKVNDADKFRKQLRLKNQELKEFQQKLNHEILCRRKLEDEIKYLKKERPKVSSLTSYKFNAYISGQTLVEAWMKIEGDRFYINEESQYLSNVFIQELKNNELHHLEIKKRALTLKVVFLREGIKSVSSSGRRNLKALEEELSREESILKGLRDLRVLLTGKTQIEADKQINGSIKKISQLKAEIDKGKKTTLTEDVPDDPVKIYEFNNHMYTPKTVPKGTLCDNCNEVLYGVVDQGLECLDCKMIVHKSCYVLGDISCEMYAAVKKGRTYYVIMRSIEDKERLLNINKYIE